MKIRSVLPSALLVFLASAAVAAPVSVRSFDAASARPVEVARAARDGAAGALVQIKGLRGAEGEALTLDLERSPLFAADFHLYVDGKDRGADVAARWTLLRGTVEQWPRSSVALTVDAKTGAWSGYLVDGDRLFEVSLPGGGERGALAGAVVVRQKAVEPLAKSLKTDVLEPPFEAALVDKAKAPRLIIPPGAEYEAKVAVESDYEFARKFDTADEAAGYAAGVLGGVSELYFRQLGVSLTISSVSLYTSPNDPWNAPDPHSGDNADVLCEFSSYWQRNRPVSRYPRNAAVFFTGKASNDIGGQAWRSSLCNYTARPSDCPYGGYGIIVVTKRNSRDTFVTAHELGHVFGSRHSHCYDPPIDQCHSGELGCYEGPESEPADGGSVMSYCQHTNLSMGEPGKYGVDSQRVVEVIRGFVDAVGPSCLALTGDPFDLAGTGDAGSAALTWVDPFGNESGWLVEQRQANGKYKQVKSLPANTTGVTVTGLKSGPNAFRVRAKVGKSFSVYSSVVTVTVP